MKVAVVGRCACLRKFGCFQFIVFLSWFLVPGSSLDLRGIVPAHKIMNLRMDHALLNHSVDFSVPTIRVSYCIHLEKCVW